MIVFGLALFGIGVVTHTIFIWVAGAALMLFSALRYLVRSDQRRRLGRAPDGDSAPGATADSGDGDEPSSPAAGVLDGVTRELCRMRLLSSGERDLARSLLADDFAFAELVAAATSIQLCVAVSDTTAVPQPGRIGGLAQHCEDGSVTYLFPHGITVLFSSAPVVADDLSSGPTSTTRPFLDHARIALQADDGPRRVLFDALPERAERLGWRWVSRPAPARRGHSEDSASHWLYPPAGPALPLEVSPVTR